MVQEFKFQGKTAEELKAVDMKDFINMLPSRQRRSLKRGFTPAQKVLLKKIRKVSKGLSKKRIKTHCRDMIIIPEMMGLMIQVHNGKEFIPVSITIDMVGHYLGEFTLTRKKIEHSAPGVGATRSSAAMSVK